MSIGTARLLELALDPGIETPEDAMGERILDAALELAAASGLRHLTMDDVAERASVGRMTVYRRFGTRQQLIDALSVRESRRCLATIAAAIDPSARLDERVASAFVAVISVIREHPLLERLARAEPQVLLRELTRNDSEAFALVREFLIAQIEVARAAGDLLVDDPAFLAELALRLGASFVLMPNSVIALDDEARAYETVRSLLAPYVPGARR